MPDVRDILNVASLEDAIEILGKYDIVYKFITTDDEKVYFVNRSINVSVWWREDKILTIYSI